MLTELVIRLYSTFIQVRNYILTILVLYCKFPLAIFTQRISVGKYTHVKFSGFNYNNTNIIALWYFLSSTPQLCHLNEMLNSKTEYTMTLLPYDTIRIMIIISNRNAICVHNRQVISLNNLIHFGIENILDIINVDYDDNLGLSD